MSMVSINWLKAGIACMVAVSFIEFIASTHISAPNKIVPLKKPRMEQSQLPTYLEVNEIMLPS